MSLLAWQGGTKGAISFAAGSAARPGAGLALRDASFGVSFGHRRLEQRARPSAPP